MTGGWTFISGRVTSNSYDAAKQYPISLVSLAENLDRNFASLDWLIDMVQESCYYSQPCEIETRLIICIKIHLCFIVLVLLTRLIVGILPCVI